MDRYRLLSRIRSAIARRAAAPDLIFSSQAAFLDNQRKEGPIWLEGLIAKLERAERRPGDDGLYSVSVEDLVGAGGFCHLNTMIVRRALYDAIGGMDESIRWECDHDLFLRLIDKAVTCYCRRPSSHATTSPISEAASMTTSLGEVQRRLFQLRVFENASLFAEHPQIRSHCRQYHGYTLKRIAEALALAGDRRSAAYYARLALAAAPTMKWFGYATALVFRSAGKQALASYGADRLSSLIWNVAQTAF